VRRRSIAGAISILAALVAGAGCERVTATPDLATPYQAVVLTNGQVYFGKLEKLGAPYPTLRDVFYIQSRQNPETKQVSNTLVKRGRELHGPDHMILNAQHILFIEPVRADSQLGKLIDEARKQAQSPQGQDIPSPGLTPAPPPGQPEKK
jgi:hypothetical protein